MVDRANRTAVNHDFDSYKALNEEKWLLGRLLLFEQHITGGQSNIATFLNANGYL